MDEYYTITIDMPDGSARVWTIDDERMATTVFAHLTAVLGEPDHIDA